MHSCISAAVERCAKFARHLVPNRNSRGKPNRDLVAACVKLECEMELHLYETLSMEKVSLLQFRREAQSVIRKVRQGKSLILTYRGEPVMRLEPI